MSLPASPITDILAHYRELRRFLSRKLNNSLDAEDIAQSSYEQFLLTAQHKLDIVIESPRALLFRIAHNLCVDHYRRQQTAGKWTQQHAVLFETQAAPASDYIVAQRQIIEKVVTQLLTLPPLRRDVFLLFRAYGMSRSEIAAHLGIKESTVAKHVVRATLDCARVFVELRASMPEYIEPATGYTYPQGAELHG